MLDVFYICLGSGELDFLLFVIGIWYVINGMIVCSYVFWVSLKWGGLGMENKDNGGEGVCWLD